jgi:DNA-binding winged helix-turn-helix (wHTH) protein
VLIALVVAHDRLVTKDELLQTVWAGTVVEEGTLASHVSMLRKALGVDSSRHCPSEAIASSARSPKTRESPGRSRRPRAR